MKTLVLGASTKPERYSYKCVRALRSHNYETVALGKKAGEVEGVQIETEKVLFENIHTVAIYLSAQNQKEYEDYILSLQPKRVLFPPGTENPRFQEELTDWGILAEEACPLVMLNIGTY